MQASSVRDPVYNACIVMLVCMATGFTLLNFRIDATWLQMRPVTAVLTLVVALGLALRLRSRGRIGTILCGMLVAVPCAAQISFYIVRGNIPYVDAATAAQPISQVFAAGLLCIGVALVLDGVLPARWGRHLLLGLAGAIAAALGSLGLFGVLNGMPQPIESASLSGMRLPSTLVLVFSGLALLAGARLRSVFGYPLQSGASDGAEQRDRTGLAAGLGILVVTLGATALVWRETIEDSIRQDEAAVAASVDRVAAAIQVNADSSITLIEGLVGLFAASEHVDESEWVRYLGSLSLADRFVGIITVGHALQVVAPVEGRRVANVYGKPVAIWPDEDAPEFIPVAYIVPDVAVAREAIGYNVASDPDLYETVQRARAGSTAVISPRIEFSRFNDPRSRVGFIVIAPVTNWGGAAGEPGSGLVYASVDMAEVVAHARTDSAADGIVLHVQDATSPGQVASLFEDALPDASHRPHTTTIEIGGRLWNVVGQKQPGVRGASHSTAAARVLLGGLVVALLLFAITWVLAGHRARALQLARTMTSELRRSQSAQQAITDTANAGIITADGNGNVLYMNPAAGELFGVDILAMPGKSLTGLMPERYREAHVAGLKRVRSGGPTHIIGGTVELAGLHADGSEFPIEVLLSAWSSEGETFFTAFIRDITPRKHAEAELEQKTRELERSNADLEQFAYVASHDLQEPLRMVASYVQLLARRYRGRLDADADEFIGFAVDGATRMQSLIQDLLAYARLGRSGKQPIPAHVGQCAHAAIGRLQEAILESGARIIVDAECEVMAIPSQLSQVFQNLIANALKFRRAEAPEIRIGAQREGANWHVHVADNGIGIDPQHRERVFAIFQRLHTRREYPGTGIGLAICRKIIEDGGGRIWVESEPGRGSVFHFTLPAAQDRP